MSLPQNNYGYPYSFTVDKRQKIEAYLAYKWGIQNDLPDDHPYKYQQASTTVAPIEPESIASNSEPKKPESLVVGAIPAPVTSLHVTDEKPNSVTNCLAYTVSGELAEFSTLEDYVAAYDLTVPTTSHATYGSLPESAYRIPMFLTGIDISIVSNNNTYFSQSNSFKGMISGNTYPVVFGDGANSTDNILQYATFTYPAPGYGGETGINYTYELGDIYIPPGSGNHTVNVTVGAAAHYTMFGFRDITEYTSSASYPNADPVNIESSQNSSFSTGRLGSFYTGTGGGSFDVGPGGDYKCTFSITDNTGRFLLVQFRGRVVTTAPAPVSDLVVTTVDVFNDMIYVSPGTYTHYSLNSHQYSREITLTQGFYLGKYEVTQAQWEYVMSGNTETDYTGAVISATPSYFHNPLRRNWPVERVSYRDIEVFCARLNVLEADKIPAGYEYALPTEWQWEYACRAGSTANTLYSWGDTINASDANWNWDGTSSYGADHNSPTDVGSYAPNALGFYDMHGNVSEMTDDYTSPYWPNEPVTDPWKSEPRTDLSPPHAKIVRGGGWHQAAEFLRTSERRDAILTEDSPYHRQNWVGFRVALRKFKPKPISSLDVTTS